MHLFLLSNRIGIEYDKDGYRVGKKSSFWYDGKVYYVDWITWPTKTCQIDPDGKCYKVKFVNPCDCAWFGFDDVPIVK